LLNNKKFSFLHSSLSLIWIISLWAPNLFAQHNSNSSVHETLVRPTLQFEACTPQNNYLSTRITQAWNAASSQSGLSLNDALQRNSSACVWSGMQYPLSGHRGNFLCSGEKDQIKNLTNRDPACVSQELVATTAIELELATQCFGITLNEILPLMMHESRFQPNAVSVGYAGGSGQLTKSAISEINNRRTSLLKAIKNKPICESSKQALEKEMWPNDTCARMLIPESPRKNLVYSVAYYQHIRDTAPNSASTLLNPWLNSWAAPKPSIEERNLIIQEVTRAMYNGGITTVGAVLNTLMATYEKFSSVQSFQETFRSALGGDRTEHGQYAKKIESEASLMNNKAAVRCSL